MRKKKTARSLLALLLACALLLSSCSKVGDAVNNALYEFDAQPWSDDVIYTGGKWFALGVVNLVFFLGALKDPEGAVDFLKIQKRIKDRDAHMEALCRTIESRDKEGLKKLFLEKALTENENIDGEIDALFAYIENDAHSGGQECNDYHYRWEKDDWNAVYPSISFPHYTLAVELPDGVYKEYEIFMFDDPEEEAEHLSNGLYVLGVTKLSSVSKWKDWQKEMNEDMRPGITIID